ncbi:MAG: TraR/DksA family transcriptional regulator [Bacteroidia bacterium]
MALSPEERVEMKELIEKSIVETESNIISLKEQTKPISPDNAIGRISRMDAINNKSVSEANLRAAKSKLSKLQRNLGRIDDPIYGNCMKCGNPIQIARLKFMPESSWCIQCARKY